MAAVEGSKIPASGVSTGVTPNRGTATPANHGTGTQGVEDDKKPDSQTVHINLKVKGQDGNEVFFRIKRSTQLKKLMTVYCERQSLEPTSVAFLFDGRRLRTEQTPDELEMEDGDEIDAMLHQTGGCNN